MVDKIIWGQLTILGSSCWLPLMFLLIYKSLQTRRTLYSIGAGIVLAVQIFSGHPQIPFYGLLSLSLFVCYMFLHNIRKKVPLKKNIHSFKYFLIAVLTGVGLAAIQLVPALELASHTFRSSFDERFAFYARWSMEAKYMLTFFFPRLTEMIGKNSHMFPVSLGFVGVLPILLAVFALKWIRKNIFILFFCLLALFSLILAAGRYTPVYRLFYDYFPGFDAFRIPIFLLYIYGFSMCLLAGFGMQRIQRILNAGLTKKSKIFLSVFLMACLLLISISLVSHLVINSNSSSTSPLLMKISKYHQTLGYDFGIVGFAVGVALIMALFWRRFGEKKVIPKISIIVLIFLELFLYSNKYIKVYDLTPFVSKSNWVDYLKADKQPYRILPILPYPEQDPVLKLNYIPSINGYGSFEILNDYVEFIGNFQDEPVHQQLCIVRAKNLNSKAVNLLNTKYILTAEPIQDENYHLEFIDEIPMIKTWDLQNTG
ncbi:hypothetical protein ACFLR7_06090, partial [Acidobacteriota bacterium]